MNEANFDFKAQEALDGSSAEVVLFSAGKNEPCIKIKFQLGPIKEVGNNGVQIEDVIDLLVTRLEGFQKGKFRCRENAVAITKLEEAIMWLGYRTAKRTKQGIEGTNAAHK